MKIKHNYRVLTPYIGRDYKSKAQVEAAFMAGYDFYLEPDTLPCSIRDFEPGVKVELRYKRQSEVLIVVTPAKEPENIALMTPHDVFMQRFTKRPPAKAR